MSQSRRAMIECIFGRGEQNGTMRKTKHRGIARAATDFILNLIAHDLIRIPRLVAAWLTRRPGYKTRLKLSNAPPERRSANERKSLHADRNVIALTDNIDEAIGDTNRDSRQGILRGTASTRAQ